MAEWLRSGFLRTKPPAPSPLALDRSSSNTVEGAEDEHELVPAPRLKQGSRVSSYIGLRSSTPPALPAPDVFPNLRHPESVYHKPSADQMAEMVKVVMMNQDLMSLIPVMYNSSILHVLEAYHDLREELKKKESEIEDLRTAQANDIKALQALAKKFDEKEKDYKTEIKNLEVLLARTDGGMEKVTLARTKSMVYGAVKTSESVCSMISTIKERNEARYSKDRGRLDITIDSAKSDNTATRRFETTNAPPKTRRSDLPQPSAKMAETPLQDSISTLSSSDEPFPAYVSPLEAAHHNYDHPALDLPSLTKTKLEELEREQARRDTMAAFESTTLDVTLRSEQLRRAEELRLELVTKQLPGLPNNTSYNYSHPGFKEEELEVEVDVPHYPSQMSFSFNPGDDQNLDVVKSKEARERTTKVLEDHHKRQVAAGQVRQERPEASFNGELVPTRKSEIPKPNSKPMASMTPTHIVARDAALDRNDSNSSVVTAVRYNGSDRSSKSTSHHQPRGGIKNSSGSSDAVTAAVRAIAGSGSGSKIPRKSTSNTDSQEDRTKKPLG